MVENNDHKFQILESKLQALDNDVSRFVENRMREEKLHQEH